MVTIHLHLGPRLRMSGAIPLLTLYDMPLWRGHGLFTCIYAKDGITRVMNKFYFDMCAFLQMISVQIKYLSVTW
jgi:hypothetical protein